MASEGYNYHSSIPWHILKTYLEKKEKQWSATSLTKDGGDMYRAQGKALILRDLQNLPEALELEEGDEGDASSHAK